MQVLKPQEGMPGMPGEQEEATMRLDTRGMVNEGILVLPKSMPST